MVLVAPSSEDEKYVNEMSPATTWLLSSTAARSYPVSIPGRYGRYVYPGSYPDTDTIPEQVEVALTRRIWYECNFNYRLGAVE